MSRPAAIAGTLLIGTLWGLNWPVVKVLLTEIPPLTIRAIAFPLAALGLAIAARARGYSLRVPPGERLPLTLTGLFVVFGFNVLASFGQVLVETSKAAIVAYTMPAITAVLAAVFLNERPGPRIWLALGIGMAGLAVLASENLPDLTARPLGPAIMLGAALSWSIGNVMLKARSWTPPALVLPVWFFVLSAALVIPLALVFEAPWHLPPPSRTALALFVFHVLGPMILCYLGWTMLVARLPATIAAISVLAAPVVGVLSSIFLLGDPATWQKGLALAMIVLSIGMTLAPSLPRRSR